jgi:hypothetical protein
MKTLILLFAGLTVPSLDRQGWDLLWNWRKLFVQPDMVNGERKPPFPRSCSPHGWPR